MRVFYDPRQQHSPAVYSREGGENRYCDTKTDTLHPGLRGKSDVVKKASHELTHRMDVMFAESWKNENFSRAISDSKAIINADPDKFLSYSRSNDNNGFLSDILSVLSDDEHEFPFYHEKKQLNKYGVKQMEVYSNLFSLEAFNDTKTLEFIKANFPKLSKAYKRIKL